MIFGFNTDVANGDTIYHVQSEPREAERRLQTLIFVGGRCIGKRATSYGECAQDPGFTEEQLQEMLKAQHRQVLEALRSGRLEEVIGAVSGPRPGALSLEWLNANAAYAGNAVVLRFQVSEAAVPVAGAAVTSRLSSPSADPVYCQAITDRNGEAEMRVRFQERLLADASLLVQATYGDKSGTKKFRLRPASAS